MAQRAQAFIAGDKVYVNTPNGDAVRAEVLRVRPEVNEVRVRYLESKGGYRVGIEEEWKAQQVTWRPHPGGSPPMGRGFRGRGRAMNPVNWLSPNPFSSNPKLVTSTETKSAERKVRQAARAKFGRSVYDAFFEHGQWWVSVGPTGERIYSAVDAVPGVHGLGIDFEEV